MDGVTPAPPISIMGHPISMLRHRMSIMVGCHACTPNQQRGNPFINDGGVSRLQHHINDGVTLCSNMQAAPIIDGGVSTLAPLHPHGGLVWLLHTPTVGGEMMSLLNQMLL